MVVMVVDNGDFIVLGRRCMLRCLGALLLPIGAMRVVHAHLDGCSLTRLHRLIDDIDSLFLFLLFLLERLQGDAWGVN